MASAEENVEEMSGRRTRSGRKVSTSVVAQIPTRSTRRSTRKLAEELLDEISEVVKEKSKSNSNDIEKVDENHILRNDSNNSHDRQNIVYENLVQEQIDDSNSMNALEAGQQAQQPQLEDIEMYSTEVPGSLDGGLDEKSSSFPFGTIGHSSETSEDVQNEEDISRNGGERNESNAVESSLLASLAGDNANSLPSVGGGEDNEIKKDFDTKVIQSVEGNDKGSNSSDDSISQVAIAEDLVDGDTSNGTNVNTELVSEDELPIQTNEDQDQHKVNYTEEVSDEELPGPKQAELPADAEVISEDELATPMKSPETLNRGRNTLKINIYTTSTDLNNSAHKRKANDIPITPPTDNDNKEEKIIKKSKSDEQYNPMSPTSETDDDPPVEKKAKCDNDSESDHKHKKKDKEKEKEKKRLPDLDKYWRAVKDDAADFTGWTYLLQYVDNESDAEAAREAYDAFLSHYPYCYGYWRKYADYEKRKGIKSNSNTVFERGLEAIPLSVDLWLHYIAHVKSLNPDNVNYIREQFDRAINACGLEFRSDKVWDAYIKWENDGKNYNHTLQIYDRLLKIPTQGHSGHFVNFQDFINQHSVTSVLGSDELKKIRIELRESRSSSRSKSSKDKERDHHHDDDKNDSNTECEDSKECSSKFNADDFKTLTEEEIASIKEKVISIRRKVQQHTVAAVTERWTFEENIKRPYFHVKPLERCQLKNWKDYLDFEIEKGDRKRILVLFERCLIACALYDEFWLKMLRYLETQMSEPDAETVTRDVFHRACKIHHPDKPSLHLMWSAFEECLNNFDVAAEILVKFEEKCPNVLQVAYRRINIERRRGALSKCCELYGYYITNAKNKNIAGSLAIKYARFLNKICNDLDEGLNILQQTLDKDPANTRVALQMIDLALQRSNVNEDEIVQIMNKFMSRENIDPEQKVLFAQRKVEFLEDFGNTAKGLQDAQRELQLALTKANEYKKKRESSPSRKGSSNTNTSSAVPITATGNTAQGSYNSSTNNNSSNANYYGSSNSSYYNQQNSSTYQQPQQSYDGYYNHWQYGSSGYSGYAQWSGYGNYY